MQDRNLMAKEAATQVLSGLYEAIADHSQFDAMLEAVDDFLDANPDGLEARDADWREAFRQHFGRVGQFLDLDMEQERESPLVYVEKQVVPAAVITRKLDIVASNELFSGYVPASPPSIGAAFSSPADKRRLSELFKANGNTNPVLVSLSFPNVAAPVFVVAMKSPQLELSGQTGALVTIKIARATWNPGLVPLLETAYNLTQAEIEVLKGLVEYGSVNSVAVARGRSVRTVRTQLTSIFAKLGLTSQTELALFLATLSQLMTKKRRPSEIGLDWSHDEEKEIQRASVQTEGHTLAYVKYGEPNGTPVLLIHSTTPPEMTPNFRAICKQNNLRVIGVHKPGAGGSSPRSPDDGPKELAQCYRAVLEAESISETVVAGHCSGGLYALQFARAFPTLSKGIVLIDTGVPFKTRRELMALPKSLRRTFLPARYIPEILLVPHRIFAANFNRSAAGEARVVDYFFGDNPVDQYLTQTKRAYYEITRQIIAYSFEDVGRLVADVQRWASNWSDMLEAVKSKKLVFVHGEENRLFESDKIAQFSADQQMTQLLAADGCGQLQTYQRPQLFADAVKLAAS